MEIFYTLFFLHLILSVAGNKLYAREAPVVYPVKSTDNYYNVLPSHAHYAHLLHNLNYRHPHSIYTNAAFRANSPSNLYKIRPPTQPIVVDDTLIAPHHTSYLPHSSNVQHMPNYPVNQMMDNYPVSFNAQSLYPSGVVGYEPSVMYTGANSGVMNNPNIPVIHYPAQKPSEKNPEQENNKQNYGEDDEKPKHDDEKPKHDDEKPNHDDEKPNHDDEKPNHDDEKPNHDDEKPNHDDEKPNYDGDKPENDAEKTNDNNPEKPNDNNPEKPNDNNAEKPNDNNAEKPNDNDAEMPNDDNAKQNQDSESSDDVNAKPDYEETKPNANEDKPQEKPEENLNNENDKPSEQPEEMRRQEIDDTLLKFDNEMKNEKQDEFRGQADLSVKAEEKPEDDETILSSKAEVKNENDESFKLMMEEINDDDQKVLRAIETTITKDEQKSLRTPESENLNEKIKNGLMYHINPENKNIVLYGVTVKNGVATVHKIIASKVAEGQVKLSTPNGIFFTNAFSLQVDESDNTPKISVENGDTEHRLLTIHQGRHRSYYFTTPYGQLGFFRVVPVTPIVEETITPIYVDGFFRRIAENTKNIINKIFGNTEKK